MPPPRVERPGGGGAPGRSAAPRRLHLDGLRTVAVYLVVAFHSSVDRLVGGFVGVDVFFVLSGYLVTQVLLRDVEARGGVRVGRFYSRRLRRLLPVAALNLVATAVVFTALAPPAVVRGAVAGVEGAALDVSNWVFVAQSADYFGPDVVRSPVAHYWSLSVEEQFYLAWPLLLGGLLLVARRVGRGVAGRERAVVRAGVALGALASVTAALVVAGHDVDRAYFGTDTRAYQLLLGALLALTPGVAGRLGRRARSALPWASGAALVALLVVATSAVALGPVVRGLVAALLTLVALATLEAAEGGWTRRALSWAPLAYLGQISYGTYLWHWIVILAVVDAHDLGGAATFAVAVPVATGLAALGHELVERPVRARSRLDAHRGAVIGAGVALSVLVGLVVAPTIMGRATGGREAVGPQAAAEGTPVAVDWRAAATDRPDVEACDPGAPRVCPRVEGDGARVLVIGESHAVMLTPMLEEVARRLDLELGALYLPYCPWTLGVAYRGTPGDCFGDQHDAFEDVVPAYDPDVVVLAHRPIDDPQNRMALRSEDEGRVDGAAAATALAEAVDGVVRGLVDDGRRVVVVEPVAAPAPEDDPLACLSEARFLEECRFVASPGPLPEEEVVRGLAAGLDGVWDLDLDPLACPYLPICDPVVGGEVVRADDNHLTVSFALTMADAVEGFLVDQGVVAPP